MQVTRVARELRLQVLLTWPPDGVSGHPDHVAVSLVLNEKWRESMTSTIEVENLTKYYGDLLAVDHVNFEVHQGEVFGFLGPNGAGKTTTQRMLTTLLEPTEGRIVINGHDLARNAYPVKRRMGLVPEESNVYTELTAWDNLMFTARLYRVGRDERAVRSAFDIR